MQLIVGLRISQTPSNQVTTYTNQSINTDSTINVFHVLSQGTYTLRITPYIYLYSQCLASPRFSLITLGRVVVNSQRFTQEAAHNSYLLFHSTFSHCTFYNRYPSHHSSVAVSLAYPYLVAL